MPRIYNKDIGTMVSIHSRRLSREMLDALVNPRHCITVSIHSRRLSREMPVAHQAWPAPPGRFNPLPAVKPGDAQRQRRGQARPPVSIHSRRLSREMLVFLLGRLLGCSVSIHSRRLSREMPATGGQVVHCGVCFNPLPAVKPGDACCCRN